MSLPYPTAAEVKAIFELENSPSGDREAFLSHVDENFNLKVISDAHPFPRTASKKEYSHIMHMQYEWMDPAYPFERSIGIVTGGGDSEWVAVEVFNHGITKAGKLSEREFLPPPLCPVGRGGGKKSGEGIPSFCFFGLGWTAVDFAAVIGQEYKANYLKLTKFNKEKKMIEMRIYLDSHQFHTTKEHVEKGHLPSHPMSDRKP